VVGDLPPGMAALLGRLRVWVASPPPNAFELGTQHPTVLASGRRPVVAEITAPGAVIGRGTDADLRLAGPASEDTSRRHLVVRPTDRQWTVANCNPKSLTYEEDEESRSWQRTASAFPISLEDGQVLLLGSEFLLRFELLAVPIEGRTTARKEAGPRVFSQRIRPASLENTAMALLSYRRADPQDRRVPSLAEMEGALFQSRANVYRRLKQLRERDEVAQLLTGTDWSHIADALELAFPYLRVPNP
jgi:hypothetical protein